MLLLAIAPCAPGFEPSDVRGLDVQTETMPGPVAVEGVALEIRTAAGSDVPALALRIEQRWRRQDGVLQRLQQDGWQLLLRWDSGRSEVVQWRGEGPAAQLFFSRLDTLRAPLRPGRGPFALPAGCAWVRIIQGAALTQRSAYCRMSPVVLRQQLRAALQSQGWVIRADTGGTLEVMGSRTSGRITQVPGHRPGESALLWMGIDAQAGQALE